MKRLLMLFLLIAAGCKAAGDAKMEKVTLETSAGNIEIELFRNESPKTVENFLAYVKEGHYDGTIFHRVIPNFMIQGGGFVANGTQKPTHAAIALEAVHKNLRGTVAMARTNVPDSATSQFFINTVDNDFLDPNSRSAGYAVFGQVTSGMDVVDKISAQRTAKKGMHDDWPIEPVSIIRARVS